MTTSRWRGTLIYTGTIATIGTVALARFGPLVADGTDTATVSDAALVGTSAPAATTAPSAGAAGSSAPTPSPSATAPSSTSTVSSTVTVAGTVAETRYGPVQVSVTFTGSQIVDVQTLQAPSEHRESAQISARSTPLLAQEVVAAQSAAIDTVSGATYTSEAYRESVQSAIDQVG